MKLYIWIDAPVKVTGKKPKFMKYDEVFIAVVADTFELAVATVQSSYLGEFGVECPYDLREDNVHETIYPSHKKAFIQHYQSDGG